MEFVGKHMKLENIISSEIILTQKVSITWSLLFFVYLSAESLDMTVQTGVYEETREVKRDHAEEREKELQRRGFELCIMKGKMELVT